MICLDRSILRCTMSRSLRAPGGGCGSIRPIHKLTIILLPPLPSHILRQSLEQVEPWPHKSLNISVSLTTMCTTSSARARPRSQSSSRTCSLLLVRPHSLRSERTSCIHSLALSRVQVEGECAISVPLDSVNLTVSNTSMQRLLPSPCPGAYPLPACIHPYCIFKPRANTADLPKEPGKKRQHPHPRHRPLPVRIPPRPYR